MKAILFDLDDTLYSRQDTFAKAYRKTFLDGPLRELTGKAEDVTKRTVPIVTPDYASLFLAFRHYGYDVYDVERKKYEDDYTAHREKLYQAEYRERNNRYEKLEQLYRRYGVSLVSVSKESEIIDKVVELFERHRHDNIG